MKDAGVVNAGLGGKADGVGGFNDPGISFGCTAPGGAVIPPGTPGAGAFPLVGAMGGGGIFGPAAFGSSGFLDCNSTSFCRCPPMAFK